MNASRFSTDNAFKIGLNTAPTTLEPFIPKNQNPCKNRYAITIAGKVLPNFNNGTCKILNMKLCTQLIKKNTVITIAAGIKASKDLATVGGTPAGSFITQPFLSILANIVTATSATIIPRNNPFEPTQSSGTQETSYVISLPFGVKVLENGVTIKNATRPVTEACIASISNSLPKL